MGWWLWCCDSRDCGGLRGIRGIGVIVIVIVYCDCVLGDHGVVVFRCDLNGG